MEKEYSIAQYCIKGHPIITNMSDYTLKTNYCPECGAKTITKCPECDTDIHGDVYVFNRTPGGRQGRYYPRQRPAFCHFCGAPYPWTSRAINNLKQTLEDIPTLTPEERSQIISDCPDIISETDATPLAANRYKKAIACAGSTALSFLSSFAANFGCALFTHFLNI